MHVVARRARRTMKNRLARWLVAPGEEEPEAGDFFVVRTASTVFCVTGPTAAIVERQLESRWAPAWLVFRDLSGSRVRIRTRDVIAVFECTAAQRAADRRFERAREREARDDEEGPSWERQC